MVAFIFRRIFHGTIVVLVMSLIVFAGVFAIGDPMDILMQDSGSGTDQDAIARVRALHGLDLPLPQQYLRFLTNLLTGDFGNSFVQGSPVIRLILERMPATLELAFAAILIALVIGIPLGLFAGLYPHRLASRMIMAGSIFGFSLPGFWVGIMLVMIFAVQLGWVPASGRGDTVEILGTSWSFLTLDGLHHLALPALNMSLWKISVVIRLTRAGTREAALSDYVRYAVSKGVRPVRVVGVHILKNIMIPVITVVALELGSMIAFATVTETIFAWPGMGKLIIDSVFLLDRPIIVAYLMIVVVMFVLINFVVDMLYMLLDPRVRLAGGRD